MFTNIVRMDYAGAILYPVRHRGACTAHTHLQSLFIHIFAI